MFDLNKLRRGATGVVLGALLLSLLVCAGFAWAQEAPRQEGSTRIKPPMIKPPMRKSKNTNSGSVKSAPRRRKPTRRKRQARHIQTESKPAVVGASPIIAMPGDEPAGASNSPASIKPPMANESDAALSVPTKRAPISGGVLNGKAISLPKPVYPPIARAARASGTVVVQVIIGEDGNIIWAQAIAGHPLLQSAAVEAARQAKFSPTTLEGQPVKVIGTINYNFVP